MTNKRILIIALIALLPYSIPSFVYSQIEQIELKLKKVIGSEDPDPPENKLLVHMPLSIDCDDAGNLYVLDAGNQRVLKFNCDYNFVWKAGRRGRGPGEFQFDAYMINSGLLSATKKGNIFVADHNNYRIQLFNEKGHYIKEVCKLPWSIGTSMDVDFKSRLYLYSPTRSINKLIHIFNYNGDYLESFVDPLFIFPSSSFNDIDMSISKTGEIYIAFLYWPILRKYDSNRFLIWEKKIDLATKISDKMFRTELNKKTKRIPLRYFRNHDPGTIPKEKTIGFGPVVTNIDVFNNKIFLLINPNCILQLDANGNPERIYHFKIKPGVNDFKVYNKSFIISFEALILIFE